MVTKLETVGMFVLFKLTYLICRNCVSQPLPIQNNAVKVKSLGKTSMHSSWMRTARLVIGGVSIPFHKDPPFTEITETSLHRDPPFTETLSGQRTPSSAETLPLDRDPLEGRWVQAETLKETWDQAVRQEVTSFRPHSHGQND